MQPLGLDRAFIRVSGAGARAFLHNLLTQDVERLGAGAPAYGGLLSPQGKVIADMLLWPRGAEDVLIEADPARAPELMRRLLMYRLRAPIAIAQADEFAAIVHFADPPVGAHVDPRMPGGALGWRAVVAREHAPEAGAEAHFARRIAAGVPDLAIDCAAEEVFALEALFEELHGVDFAKGCFVGQENVSRMKRRATTRRKFCPIVFEGPAPAFATPILAGEFEIGTVRSGVEGRALALVRLDRAREAACELRAGGREMRLDPPAWLIRPGDE